jgi:hypothetical protein
MTLRLSIVLIVLLFISASVQAQPSTDAKVISIKGKAWVRDNEKAEPNLLKEGQELNSPQQVKCDTGCKEVMISRCNITRPFPKQAKWTTILSISCDIRKFPRGGTIKGDGITIVSPREAEVVRPDTFAIGWQPTEPSGQVNISLKNLFGDQIWGTRVSSSVGLLKPEELQQRLKEAQKANDLNFVLIFDHERAREPQQVRFSLIAADAELKLTQRLLAVDEEGDEVFRRVSRGLVLGNHDLYQEAVPEFEQALTLLDKERESSKTVDRVVRLLIRTHYLAYNDEEVKRRCAQIKESPPPDCSAVK